MKSRKLARREPTLTRMYDWRNEHFSGISPVLLRRISFDNHERRRRQFLWKIQNVKLRRLTESSSREISWLLSLLQTLHAEANEIPSRVFHTGRHRVTRTRTPLLQAPLILTRLNRLAKLSVVLVALIAVAHGTVHRVYAIRVLRADHRHSGASSLRCEGWFFCQCEEKSYIVKAVGLQLRVWMADVAIAK